MTNFASQRANMVQRQLVDRGIRDPWVLKALGTLPREKFISPGLNKNAYSDSPVPIGHGQTISQPYMVALMTEALELKPQHRVLEIGTGSGYQAAVLSLLVTKVYTVERIPELTRRAREIFEELGLENILSRTADGTIGWEEYAPYDRIVVTAAAPQVPPQLLRQLAPGGRLVIPVGEKSVQTLRILERREDRIAEQNAGSCVFVPLIGKDGWED
jgi:protein-L-isoaspartate(D-aspartate) O-methyltransferase